MTRYLDLSPLLNPQIHNRSTQVLPPCPTTFSGSYIFKIVMSACWRRDRTGDVLYVENEDFIVIELLKK